MPTREQLPAVMPPSPEDLLAAAQAAAPHARRGSVLAPYARAIHELKRKAWPYAHIREWLAQHGILTSLTALRAVTRGRPRKPVARNAHAQEKNQ